MGLSLDKIEQKAPGLLNLAKTAVSQIDKSGLNGQVAKVALVLDYSGSMSQQYSSGAMQRLAEKVLALGTQFDDDGAIDFFVFDRSAAHLGEITIDNYKGSVDRLTKSRRMATTNYAAAFLAVRNHFGFAPPAPAKKGLFGGFKKAQPAENVGPANEPVYALFLTDGSPDSKADAIAALTEVSTAPIFWKFLSIGSESMPFLQKLDDLKERFVDNADYQPVGNVDNISDTELFSKLLVEYPEWVKEVRAKGLIK